MKRKLNFQHGFTPIELLVLLVVLAVLATIMLPVFNNRCERPASTRALSNARGIAQACAVFAVDHDGYFPSNLLDAQGKATATPPSTANDALAQLIPDYVPDKNIFWLAQDRAYCNASPPKDSETRLRAGENHWGYVINLTDKSNPKFPLIADGAALGGTHYSTDEDAAGGTWKGSKAIVVRVDGSASIEITNKSNLIIPGPNADIPNQLQAGQKNWLGPNNWFLNPIPKAF